MIESILTDFNHDKKVFTAVEVERHFLPLVKKRSCKLTLLMVVVYLVLPWEQERKLIPTYICVLKMFVHPDGASTTVLVTLPVKNVRRGPTQV